jgi:hypothetical protein
MLGALFPLAFCGSKVGVTFCLAMISIVDRVKPRSSQRYRNNCLTVEMEKGVPPNILANRNAPHPGASGGGGDGTRSHGLRINNTNKVYYITRLSKLRLSATAFALAVPVVVELNPLVQARAKRSRSPARIGRGKSPGVAKNTIAAPAFCRSRPAASGMAEATIVPLGGELPLPGNPRLADLDVGNRIGAHLVGVALQDGEIGFLALVERTDAITLS